MNPWGEESYADLISQALESAANGRLRLNEIYLWFVENVAYFRERASAEESSGWKVKLERVAECEDFEEKFDS